VVTTLDTAGVTCQLSPVLAMRGRLSDAEMIGMTQTIASDEAEYIDIAVRLALDPAWRQGICRKESGLGMTIFMTTNLCESA